MLLFLMFVLGACCGLAAGLVLHAAFRAGAREDEAADRLESQIHPIRSPWPPMPRPRA